jgi:DNA-binding FadR family transcriptional regulator
MILSQEPWTQIGSLSVLVERLNVGVVTVQQAARILENEGFLEVRRGPGGGYFGKRPSEANLEHSLVEYLRMHTSAYRDALELLMTLKGEAIAAAARCREPDVLERLQAIRERIVASHSREQRLAIEEDFRLTIHAMSDRPLLSLFAGATARFVHEHAPPALVLDEQDELAWKAANIRVIDAILAGDEELALFESSRLSRHIGVSIARLVRNADASLKETEIMIDC